MAVIALTFLGTFEILRDGVHITHFRGDKVRALLVYLATQARHPHERMSLAALLWPDQPHELALRNLTQTLVRLREMLGDDAPLNITRHTLQWDAGRSQADSVEFAQLAGSDQSVDLVRAVELYGGEFLPGFGVSGSDQFEEWLLLTREQLHKQVLGVLATLATRSEEAGNYVALSGYARRQIALEPWYEPAHRQLMRGLALSGDRNAALAQYERCRAVLASELGVEPEVETRTLYERIRANVLVPVRSSVAAPRHNLPPQLTPFVGRGAELAELAALQQQREIRLLTLVGAGGMGKTRLALEVARASLDAYTDGVFFVALAPLTAASELPAAIAQAINMSTGSDLATLLRFLHDKHMLLVLDNFEHLLDGATIVMAIIESAPHVQILATSRERLNVRGEQRFPVSGLPYTSDSTSDDVPLHAAAELFLQSARRVQHTFSLDATNRAAVLRLCQLVQGMPLGLELAAAGLETLPLEIIVAEVEQSADILAADWRDVAPRQRSMRAIFDWSWRLLSADEQRVFCQLSIFRGGFTREAAQAVTGVSLLMLTQLVQKSLVRAGAERYEIHELVRQFAAEHLNVRDDDRAAVEARHSAYYLAFVAAQEQQLARTNPRKAVAALQSEIGNIRQAWMSAAMNDRVAELDRSAYCIWLLYTITGPVPEGVHLLQMAGEGIQQVLESAFVDEPTKRSMSGILSKVLAMRASLSLSQGNQDQVLDLAGRAIALAQQASDGAEGESLGLLVQGQALRRKGLSSEARERLIRAAHVAQHTRAAGSSRELLPEVEWRACNWLCSIALTQDNYDAARTYATAGVEVCRSLGKRTGEISSLTDIVDIAFATGDYEAARREGEYTLHLAKAVGHQRVATSIQCLLGTVARLQGEYTFAYEMSLQARTNFQVVGDILGEAYAVCSLAYLHLFMGDYAGAQGQLDAYTDILHAADMPAREVFLGLLPRALLNHAIGDYVQARVQAEQAWQMAQQLDGRSSQAHTLVMLGMVYASLDRFDDAVAAYEHALVIYRALGHTHLATEPQAGLARVALARGDLLLAHAHAETLWQLLVQHPRAGLDEPFALYLTCYRVFAAMNDPRAAHVAQTGGALLSTYADQIADAALRQSFLENVATHRELLRVEASIKPL